MTFLTPTTPNAADYLTFLRSVVGVPVVNFPSVSGTLTTGGTTTVVDSSQTWSANQWVGYGFYDVTVAESSYVTANTATQLTLSPALGMAAAAGDTYLVLPAAALTTLAVALEVVNDTLAAASGMIYTLAVYNLATDRLMNYASDVQGQTYFTDLRKTMNLLTVSVGVASSANDGGTSVGLLNPDSMRAFTLQDLQTLKTPWGRQYMAYAQMYGPALWGLT